MTVPLPETPVRAALEQAAMDKGSGDRAVSTISGPALNALSFEFGQSLRGMEIAALEAGIWPERYLRNHAAYSRADQIRLLRSRAVVVGLGGLGGFVLEMLARMGLGGILGADGDVFEESNLNRQLLSDPATLGKNKAEAAGLRIRAVNPSVEFTARGEFLDPEAMADAVAGADVVLDCLGGLDDRPALRKAAGGAKVPLVTAAVAGSAGMAAVALPGAPSMADFLAQTNKAAAEDSLGTQAPAVALAASLQVQLAVAVVLKRPLPAPGSALVFDLSDMTFETMVL